MILPSLPDPSFSSLLFHLDSLQQHVLRAGDLGELIAQEYMLLIFHASSSRIYMNGRNKVVSAQGTYLLPPGASCQFESIDGSDIAYQVLHFSVFKLHESQPLRFTDSLFPGRLELDVYPVTAWLECLDSLWHAAKSAMYSPADSVQLQISFQQVIFYLLRQNGQEQHEEHRLKQTIHYMEKHFREPLSVKQLAEMSNIPAWSYTRQFRELTGQKPLDYLTDLRIAHAKTMLADPSVPLREIARLCGFSDEYYFNRRFSALTGLTPRQYSRSACHQTTLTDWTGHQVQAPKEPKSIIYFGECSDDLRVLGIVPIGLKTLYDTNPQALVEEAAELQPDLMILTKSDEQLYGRMAEVGPTLTHDTHASLENRLITLGSWLNKREAAAEWLDNYQNAVEQMWQKLSLVVKPTHSTASVLTLERGGRLFIMGSLGLSAFLFHQHGFQPAGRIKEIIRSGRPYREIPLSSLPQHAGDYIFVIRSRDQSSSLAYDRLLTSKLWLSLPAVQHGCSYVLDDEWNDAGALTQQKLVSKLPEWLTGKSPCAPLGP